MSYSLHIIIFCFTFTYVNCNQLSDDLKCLQSGVNAIKDKTDEEIYNMTQQGFGAAFGKAHQRGDSAAKLGYTCYAQSYGYLAAQLGPVVAHPGEKNLLDKARDENVRSDAVKRIRAYGQLVTCDEDWRDKTFPKRLRDSVCGRRDLAHYESRLAQYQSMLAKLNNQGFVTTVVSAEKNPVVADLMKTRLDTYQGMFNNALTCCQGMSTLADKCKCIKLQAYELDRLFYMLSLPHQQRQVRRHPGSRGRPSRGWSGPV